MGYEEVLLVEEIVTRIVQNPADVIVERSVDEKGVLLQLTVNPLDLGRVIGKGGMTSNAIRTLLKVLALKNDAHYSLKITDNGPKRESRER